MHRGRPYHFEISAGLITIGDRKAILAFNRDITVRKLAEIDTLQFHFANPAICAFIGYSQEALLKMRVPDIHPPQDREWILAKFQSQANEAQLLAQQIPCLQIDGHVVYADIRSGRIQIDGRSYLTGFFADVTEQLGIKEALSEQVLQKARRGDRHGVGRGSRHH